MLPAPPRGGGCTVTLVIERLWRGTAGPGSAPGAAVAAIAADADAVLLLRQCALLWWRRCRVAVVGVCGAVVGVRGSGSVGLLLPLSPWLLWCRRCRWCRWCRCWGSLSVPMSASLGLALLLLALGVRAWRCVRRLLAPVLGFRGGATKSASGGTGGADGSGTAAAAGSTTTTGSEVWAGSGTLGDAGLAGWGSLSVILCPGVGGRKNAGPLRTNSGLWSRCLQGCSTQSLSLKKKHTHKKWGNDKKKKPSFLLSTNQLLVLPRNSLSTTTLFPYLFLSFLSSQHQDHSTLNHTPQRIVHRKVK